MTALPAARNAILLVVETGWNADALTSPLTLLWDDVRGDKPGFDTNGKPIAYGRATLRHTTSETETIGGRGLGKELHEGFVVVQCFGPKGRGYADAAAIAQVVKRFFQRQPIGSGVDGWFFNTTAVEFPVEESGAHDQINVTAQFRYSERV